MPGLVPGIRVPAKRDRQHQSVARPGMPGHDEHRMSPELAFILSLALRMAFAAAFVVAASFITERSGPAIGALVATLPVSAGPSYIFLALDHDAAFIAQGALASLPMNAATILMSLVLVVMAQRHGTLVSLAAGLAVWLVFALLVRAFEWTLLGGLLFNALALGIVLPLVQRFRVARMPLIARRWYDIPLRAALVATLVAAVVTLSNVVGPRGSGVLALFPAVFTSLVLILMPRIGGPRDRRRAGERPVGPDRLRPRDRRVASDSRCRSAAPPRSASLLRYAWRGTWDCSSTADAGARGRVSSCAPP